MTKRSALLLSLPWHRAGLVAIPMLLLQLACQPSSQRVASPQQAQRYFTQALDQAKRGNTNKALQLLNASIAAKPDFADAYNNKGNVLMMMRKFGEATGSYSDAIRIDSNNMAFRFNRGYALLLANNTTESLKDLNRVIEKEPNNGKARALRGQARLILEDFAGAIQDFDQASSLLPENGQLFANRGVAQAKLGNVKAAQADFSKAEALFRATGDQQSLAQLLKAKEALLRAPSSNR